VGRGGRGRTRGKLPGSEEISSELFTEKYCRSRARAFLRDHPSVQTSVQIFTLFGQDPRHAAPVYIVAIMRIIFIPPSSPLPSLQSTHVRSCHTNCNCSPLLFICFSEELSSSVNMEKDKLVLGKRELILQGFDSFAQPRRSRLRPRTSQGSRAIRDSVASKLSTLCAR